MARTIHTKDERQAQFIKIGLKLAKKSGIAKVSVAAVAAEAKVTAPLIFHNFGSREKYHAALAKAAKDQGIALPEASAVTAPKRTRSVAEVKAIKDKTAGKRKTETVRTKRRVGNMTVTTTERKPAAPKAVKKAVAPKAVSKAARKPAAVRRTAKSRVVAAAEAPSVSAAFAKMPAPKGADSNLTGKV